MARNYVTLYRELAHKASSGTGIGQGVRLPSDGIKVSANAA